MNSGKIEQVGTPFEIYNYPTTAFAASFVGQLNLIPITVADAASGNCAFNGNQPQHQPTLRHSPKAHRQNLPCAPKR